jgi:hypothetical protein
MFPIGVVGLEKLFECVLLGLAGPGLLLSIALMFSAPKRRRTRYWVMLGCFFQVILMAIWRAIDQFSEFQGVVSLASLAILFLGYALLIGFAVTDGV